MSDVRGQMSDVRCQGSEGSLPFKGRVGVGMGFSGVKGHGFLTSDCASSFRAVSSSRLLRAAKSRNWSSPMAPTAK